MKGGINARESDSITAGAGRKHHPWHACFWGDFVPFSVQMPSCGRGYRLICCIREEFTPKRETGDRGDGLV